MNSGDDRIYKIGAVILDSSKLLVVQKSVPGRTEYIIPGGKPEDGETAAQTLTRELREELQVTLESMAHFGTFEETAAFERVPITIEVYITTITGYPLASSEIKECVWIDRDYEQKDITLGTVLSKHVIPQLIHQGLM